MSGWNSGMPRTGFSRDSYGGKSPDEILKSIDKDLSKNSLDRSQPGEGVRPLDLERELRSPADKMLSELSIPHLWVRKR